MYQGEVYYTDELNRELVCISEDRAPIPLHPGMFKSLDFRGKPDEPKEEVNVGLHLTHFVEVGNLLYALKYGGYSDNLMLYDGAEWVSVELEPWFYGYEVLDDELYLRIYLRRDPNKDWTKIRVDGMKRVVKGQIHEMPQIISNIRGEGAVWAVDPSWDIFLIEKGGERRSVANLKRDLGASSEAFRPIIIVANENFAVIQWLEGILNRYDEYLTRQVLVSANGDIIMTDGEMGIGQKWLAWQPNSSAVDDYGNLWFLEDCELVRRYFGTQRILMFDGENLHASPIVQKGKLQLITPALVAHRNGCAVLGMSLDWSQVDMISFYLKSHSYLVDVRFKEGRLAVDNINLGLSNGVGPDEYAPMIHRDHLYFTEYIPSGRTVSSYHGDRDISHSRLSRYALMPTSQ